MQSLTAQQQNLLNFLKDTIASTGVAPSVQEMADHMKLSSKSGVHRMLTDLQLRRRIYRPFGKQRCIEIIEDAPDLSAFDADILLSELRARGFQFGRITYAK